MLKTPIQGYGLLLREFNDNDIPAVVKIAANPNFNFYALAPHTASASEIEISATRFVHRAKELQQIDPATQIRESYKLVVAEVTSPDQLIGYVALDELSEHNGEKRDIGYFTDPVMQGKGYATLASVLLLEQFFAKTSYDLVHATVHPDNTPSRRILKKLGYKEIDSITKSIRDVIEPRIVLSLDRNDFYDATKPFRNKTTDQNSVKLATQKEALDYV